MHALCAVAVPPRRLSCALSLDGKGRVADDGAPAGQNRQTRRGWATWVCAVVRVAGCTALTASSSLLPRYSQPRQPSLRTASATSAVALFSPFADRLVLLSAPLFPPPCILCSGVWKLVCERIRCRLADLIAAALVPGRGGSNTATSGRPRILVRRQEVVFLAVVVRPSNHHLPHLPLLYDITSYAAPFP